MRRKRMRKDCRFVLHPRGSEMVKVRHSFHSVLSSRSGTNKSCVFLVQKNIDGKIEKLVRCYNILIYVKYCMCDKSRCEIIKSDAGGKHF